MKRLKSKYDRTVAKRKSKRPKKKNPTIKEQLNEAFHRKNGKEPPKFTKPQLRIMYAHAKSLGESVPEFEEALATSAYYSERYASEVLHRRFYLGEDKIAKVPRASYRYALNVIKGRWEQGEYAIAHDPECALNYAYLIGERFPLGEILIAFDSDYSYLYTRWVIKGRWKRGEKIILTDPGRTYWYVKYIIQDRWKAAEETLKKDEFLWQHYQDFVKLPYSERKIDLTSNFPKAAHL